MALVVLYRLFKKLMGSRVLICQLGQGGGRLFGEGAHISAASYSTKWLIRGRRFEVV